ncbi:hypothetical protein J7M00_06600 [bacterium]|nr:hypothetical protein [bacterium]
MKRLTSVFLIFLIITFAFALANSSYAPKPQTPKLIDIPGDAGTNVLLQWRHFETVPGIRYDILRSEDGKNFEVITPLQTKTITYEPQDQPENDVSDLGYFLVLVPQENDLPIARVIKATEENRDSIISAGGKKILRVELGVPPLEEMEKLPNKFALGDFYRVIPDEEIANRPQPMTVPQKLFDALGIKIPSLGDVSIELTPKAEELEFVRKGKRILAAGEDNMPLTLKYGKQIVSFVTEDARYTVKSDNIQFLDRKSDKRDMEAGKHYIYKVRLYQKDIPIKKIYVDSDTAGITPQDEPPVVPDKIEALYDRKSNTAVIHINQTSGLSAFFDNKTYTIFKTTAEDTACERGSEIRKVSASIRAVILKDVDSTDVLYIVVEDEGGQTTKTGLIPLTPVELEKISLPPNLRVRDVENDRGQQIAIRWDPPTLAVGYSVEDVAPKMMQEKVASKNIFYLPTEKGGTLFVAEDPSQVPDGARKVLNLSYTVPGGKKVLKITYQMWTNSEDKALYGEFSLDGKDKIDKDNTGELQFRNIAEGEYSLIGHIIKSSGSRLKNPEANIDMKIDATHIHSVPIDVPPYIYYIYRGTDAEDLSTFEYVGKVGADAREFKDIFDDYKTAHHKYYYIVQAIGPDGAVAQSEPLGPVEGISNWFNTSKLVIFFGVLVFVGVALFFIYHAKRGKQFYIRPIAGIVHIDEALGRATEMGKPIVYITGLGYIDDIATLSSITILGRVARKAAEYQCRIFVPCYTPLVMIVAQETVRNAFLDAGRPDLYNEEDVYYIAAQQFAYAAAVSGLMIREKSAANFFMGRFYAESLILAETGASTGAIQVAGTDDMTQLPFFITACDYTLIGEELYAASAYLSNDPMQRGSLKAQDFLKAIEMILLVVGSLAATAGMWWFTNAFRALGGD